MEIQNQLIYKTEVVEIPKDHVITNQAENQKYNLFTQVVERPKYHIITDKAEIQKYNLFTHTSTFSNSEP